MKNSSLKKKLLTGVTLGAIVLGGSGCGIGESMGYGVSGALDQISREIQPVTVKEYNDAVAKADALDGKYSSNKENKEFIDKMRKTKLISLQQYDDIKGKGFLNSEKDMDFVRDIIQGNFDVPE